jgi:hypothetical protein
MKSIALVTMVFLPGTFLAVNFHTPAPFPSCTMLIHSQSVFSMTFFDWSAAAGSENGTVSKWIWVFVVMTLALTAFTLALWYYLVVQRERRRANTDEEMGLMSDGSA